MREVCPICYENLDNTCVSGICNHFFHFDCLNKWLELNPSCPCCRNEINHLVNPETNETYLYEQLFDETIDIIDWEEEIAYDNYIIFPITNHIYIYVCILSIPIIISIKIIEYKDILEISLIVILVIFNTIKIYIDKN